MASCVCAAPLRSFALTRATFYMVGLLPELLLCHTLSLNFVLHYLGSVGELQLFCLLLSGQGPGASSPSTVAGKARTESVGLRDIKSQ